MKKMPLCLQKDSMQCGIACLQMVCKYFGREYSMDSLSKLCFATTEGVSMLGINEAANILGLHTTCVRAATSIFSKAPLPCVLHWNQNHFVVLYKVKNGKEFCIADPGKGLVTYSLEEFKNSSNRTFPGVISNSFICAKKFFRKTSYGINNSAANRFVI